MRFTQVFTAIAVMGLASQSLAAPAAQSSTTALVEKRTNKFIEFTEGFLKGFFKRDAVATNITTTIGTGKLDGALAEFNKTIHAIKASESNSTVVGQKVRPAFEHLKHVINATLTPEEKAEYYKIFHKHPKNTTAIATRDDAKKDGTIAGDAASFAKHVGDIFSGLFESAEKREVAARDDAKKDGTIAGDAASFAKHVGDIFTGLFDSVEKRTDAKQNGAITGIAGKFAKGMWDIFGELFE